MFERFVTTVVFIILFGVVAITFWLMIAYPEYFNSDFMMYMDSVYNKDTPGIA